MCCNHCMACSAWSPFSKADMSLLHSVDHVSDFLTHVNFPKDLAEQYGTSV